MKKYITTLVFIFSFTLSEAQSTYPSTAYAINGDTLYLTGATISSTDFSATGANSSWDYSSLTGVSQQQLVFRNPKQTGFNAAQWPYLQNVNNVNLSSTDGQSIAIGSIQTSNANDYFKTTTAVLQESASSYDVYIGSKKISIKNTYTSPDVVYTFPIAFNNLDSSTAQYATNIPNVYYNSSTIKRKNQVDGWGTIKTPYGTFNNALRIVSTVNETDSIAIDGISTPMIYTTYREIKWLDASKKYPVMIVHQNKVGSQFVTSTISYLDVQQFYQPTALFAFYPLAPMPGDTLHVQNLSVNSLTYTWDFGDPTSGSTNNTSTAVNPQHIYTIAGKYQIKLKTYNGILVDSITLPVQVGISPIALFIYSPSSPFTNDLVSFQNNSSNATTYAWDFGDPTSGSSNTSTSANPQHTYTSAASYQVKLKAYNGSLVDSVIVTVQVKVKPTASFTYSPSSPATNAAINFQNNSSNATTYIWDFGDPASGSNNTSTSANPQHSYTSAASYQVKLKAYNGSLVDSVTVTLQVKVKPTASFTYSPSSPVISELVNFQNNSSAGVTYAWDFGDPTSGSANASTDENPQHTYSTAASYQVKLKVFNGSLVDSVTQTIQVLTVVTGIISSSSSPQLLLYPNPSDQYVTVLSNEQYVHVAITDLSGNILVENKVTENQVDLAWLQKGCYILYFTEASGKQAQVKVIKK